MSHTEPSSPTGTSPASERYPAADRADVVDRPHGVAVPDPYRWLEDPDDPRTRDWSAAQDELLARARTAWPGREHVQATVRELLGTGSVGVPVHRPGPGGERVFHSRREPDAELPVLLVREPDPEHPGDTRERALVDPAALDPSGTTMLDSWSPSPEGDLLAYQLSSGGTEESAVRVLDVATGEVVDGPVDRARYSPVAWLPREPDGTTRFYYVRRLPPEVLPEDERQYHRRVWLHTVGRPTDEDVEVFGAGLPMTTYFGVGVSRDGRWLVVSASDGTAPRTDVWLADLAGGEPAAPVFTPVAVGLDAQHGVWVGRDGRLYALTDHEAPRSRLCVADPTDPGVDRWRELVPEDPSAVLEDVAVLDGDELPEPLLLVLRSRHAVAELAVHRLADGTPVGEVALPGVGSAGALVTRREGGPEAWFSYTDHTTPSRVLHLDGRRLPADPPGNPGPAVLEPAVWALPPGEPPTGPAIRAQQLTFTSSDGSEVRLVVVARDDALDATGAPRSPVPTVLYGYGGFGISLSPGYSASVLAWVRAGGAWAVAGLRGGGEEGEDWHRAGMREHKQQVFDDFHAAADTLVARGWTTPRQLGISGGSNGGLLVGAALTQRPDAYAAVLCSAPLLDMARYERHGLGALWREEFGSAEHPEELGWLLSYSPYHRALAGAGTAYPAVLFTVFDGDTRVDPLHARKTCAALQHATVAAPAERPVLLRREQDVGHAGRSLSRTVELAADGLLFLAAHTGLGWPEDGDRGDA